MNILAEVAQESLNWPDAFALVGIMALSVGAIVFMRRG